MAIEFRPHGEKQELALFATTPLVVLGCGIQFGKTKVGSVWMAMKCHKYTAETDNFIIVAPTYKILAQSTLPPFLAIMQGRGTYNKAEMTFKIHGGGTIYCRSGDNPDSIVGITNVRAIWGDEAGLFGLYFSENIAARAAFKGAQILYTTSPYTLNWLYKTIILPKIRDNTARPDVTLIQAASWENPYFPKDVIERNRKTMDPKRFNAMFGGSWERMEGLVYDCWDDNENTIEPFTLPQGTKFYGGIDWGHTHPFVLKVRAVTPNGMHYGVSEYYKTGLTITDMIEVAKSKMITWGIERFFCGPDRPENIVELCRAGLPAVAARNDVQLGIDVHYQLIKSRRFKIFQGSSPYTMDELSKYHWPSPEELGQDKDAKERNPVKQDDDALDVDRYLSIMTANFDQTKRKVHTPQENTKLETHEFIERLKAKRRPTDRTENWS